MKPRTLLRLYLCSLVLLSGLYVLPARGQSARSVDIFVAENPRALSIYNRYQQKISLAEGRLFQPFVPMEVVEYNATLSDNFTRCMTVRIGIATFFLLRDDDDTLTNVDQAGYIGAFRNCTVVGDTIQVMLDNVHTVSPRFNTSDEIDLRKENLVRRLFRKDNSDFVQILGQTAAYGWTYFSPRKQNRTWEIYKSDVSAYQGAIPERVRERVQARIREINNILYDLFRQLNTESSGLRPVPQWQVEVTETQIVCTINDPSYIDRFSESMQYIINDLENVVRGTGLIMQYTDGVIEIKEP